MNNSSVTIPYIHTAAYQFNPLSDLVALKAELTQICQNLALKGTILLATEGINLMLAGTKEHIAQFKTHYPTLPFKDSVCQTIPFKRLKVQIKKEIIRFGMAVQPEQQPAPYITPQQLKERLDKGEAIILIDARNQYEIQSGTFQNALTLNIRHFTQFPKAIEHAAVDKTKPVVTFCTGGIRCEKAALHLMQTGFKEVYQLEGGILNYFKQCAGAYYEGKCFVFDERENITSSDLL